MSEVIKGKDAAVLFHALLTAKSETQIRELCNSYKEHIASHIGITVTLADCDCKQLECLQGIGNNDTLASMENTLLAGRCSHVSQNGHAADCSDVAIVIGVNPIHVAVASGNISLINALLASGAHLNSLTRFHHMSVFEIAIRSKQHAVAEWLVNEKGFHFFRETLLCSTVTCICGESTCKQRLGSVLTLLKRCINRAEWRNADLCLKAGAHMHSEVWQQYLYTSVHRSNVQLLRWCLSHCKADLNTVRDRDGCSVLQEARTGEVAEILMDAGASPTVSCKPRFHSVMYPLTHQVFKKRWEVAEAVLRRYPHVIDLRDTPGQEDTNTGYTAIQTCAVNGDVEGLKLCHRYKADHRLLAPDGNNALMLASYIDSEECVDYLLELGSDTNVRDKDGDTALIYATYHGNYRIVESLLNYGANPSLGNNAGITPIWNAVFSRSLMSVKHLLMFNVDPAQPSRGQNIHSIDEEGNHIYDEPVTPLFVAIHLENLSIIKSLTAAGCYVQDEKFGIPNFDIYVERWTEENKRWLQHVTSHPPSLIWWCKRSVRRLLPTGCLHVTNELPIPSHLKTYLQES